MHIQRFLVGLGLLMLVAAGAGAQEIVFTLDASVPGYAAGEHGFGVLDGADAGVDANDVPEPPVPPGTYLVAAFQIPGLAEPNRWRRDMRHTSDFTGDLRETWNLVIETNATLPANCTVDISPESGDASSIWIIFSGALADTMQAPLTVEISLTGAETELGIEIVDESVPVDPASWSEIKKLYE